VDDVESNGEAAGGSLLLEDKTESVVEESVEMDKKLSIKSLELPLRLPEITTEEAQGTSSFKTHTINLTRGRKVMSAFKQGDVKTLSILFNVEHTDVKGDTLLHYAVLSACEFDETFGVVYRYIDDCMNKESKLNVPNKDGYTAIGLALHNLHKTCVKHMLSHPSAHRLYLDYYPGDSDQTVREIIMQTYPDLVPLLQAPLMEKLDSSERNRKLLAALQHDKYNIFVETLDLTNPNPWYEEPYYSTLLEIACQMKNRKEFVKLLLDSGADPNIKNRVTGMPLVHATARSGNFEVLRILLEKEEINVEVKDNEDSTILHWWARVIDRKQDKKSIEKCFELLMNRKFFLNTAINFRDSSGRTALYITVERGFQERATLLLTWGADVMEFEHGSKLLLSASLSMLEGILDNCVESNDEPMTSKDYKLTLKYRLLMNIYPRLAESHHLRDLLKHSVIQTFLNFKWQELKLIFFLDLSFYVLFVISLTSYILYFGSYTTNDKDIENNSSVTIIFNRRYIRCGTNDVNFIPGRNLKREGEGTMDDSVLDYLWYFLMTLLGLLVARETFQLVAYRWQYVLSLQNWLKTLLIIFTFISCSGVVDDMEIELHLSAVSILLGWVELLLLSGRLPQLSEQMEMLRTVSVTFLKFMAGYAFLLLAFAFSFYILFKGSLELDGTEMFTNPFLSILKTIVMFAGEFEASNLSFDVLPYTSHVIFLLFVFLVTIILLNLLNGLAVSDTDSIRKKAETLSLVARVKLISTSEALLSALPSFMTPSLNPTEDTFVLYPNRSDSVGSIFSQQLLIIISKKKKRDKKRKWTGNRDKWDFFTENFSALQLRQKEFENKFDLIFDDTKNILLRYQELEKKLDFESEATKQILLQQKQLENKLDLILGEIKHILLRHEQLEKKFDMKFVE
jgi:ankyrin repeat protein